MSADQFRDALAAMVGSDLPACIDREAYRKGLAEQWVINPARAFLRLTDDDQAKVLDFLTEGAAR